tara:strand:- start:162 stop:488 length:327 start_codon:yes stop_codon:yes gene_type:complete
MTDQTAARYALDAAVRSCAAYLGTVANYSDGSVEVTCPLAADRETVVNNVRACYPGVVVSSDSPYTKSARFWVPTSAIPCVCDGNAIWCGTIHGEDHYECDCGNVYTY